jgi:hypothetical protein
LTLRVLLEQVSKAAFDVDRGVWYTVKSLLIRPGDLINEYLDGRRIRYTNPFTLLLLFVGINAVLYPSGLIDFSRISASPPEMQEATVNLTRWIFQYYSLSMLLLLPMWSCISKWCFAASGRNYAEHLIVNTYVAATQVVFMTCTFPLLALLNQTAWLGVAWNLQIPIMVIYSIFALAQVFAAPVANAKVVMRATMTTVLYYVALAVPMFVAAVAYAVIVDIPRP